ncbi:uncharacterized protein TRUGW13939_07638 [Talaromyces rugulosus]|uniref:Uncharacterized protein n=1 Tax=Talaromyces rugulosus TaxID=121627 RepID=A0A7H8R6N7_TALRU|nr:uncharacterized protein TRUGW13939_07638 [Talaromyces rugulosus]QKX60493.1 hypothetical protein TRUGW13939_07638 [Talaromyces rugulosus]
MTKRSRPSSPESPEEVPVIVDESSTSTQRPVQSHPEESCERNDARIKKALVMKYVALSYSKNEEQLWETVAKEVGISAQKAKEVHRGLDEKSITFYVKQASSGGVDYTILPPHGNNTAHADFEMLSANLTNVNPAEWFAIYQSCVKHFLDIAQHRPRPRSLAALINIRLPYQWDTTPICGYFKETNSNDFSKESRQYGPVSLIPYIRRLVVTATDTPSNMQELFGDDWVVGISSLHVQERVNYLFAAKSSGWLKTKAHYDNAPHETIPALLPLRDPQEEELRAADAQWSRWLLMEDWMVGPRSPFNETPEND